MRDQIFDFVRRWSEQSEIHAGRFIAWLGIAPSKFYSWRRRYGCVNEHNGWVARDFWLEEWEKQALLDFYRALSPTFPTFLDFPGLSWAPNGDDNRSAASSKG